METEAVVALLHGGDTWAGTRDLQMCCGKGNLARKRWHDDIREEAINHKYTRSGSGCENIPSEMRSDPVRVH